MKQVIYSMLTVLIAYFTMALITWEIDPDKWTWIGRFTFVWLTGCSVGVALAITLEEKK